MGSWQENQLKTIIVSMQLSRMYVCSPFQVIRHI